MSVSVLFAAGDVLAQTVTMEKGGKYDRPRIKRAAIYGAFILGPLAHLHFNFMEWLIVKKVGTRLLGTCIYLFIRFSIANNAWICSQPTELL